MDLDATFLPDPDFADAQLAIDVELVDAAPRPDHLDRDVRSGLELRLETEHIAFVRLDAALVLLALQGPGAVGRELDASLETPSFDETPYVGLDFIVLLDEWTPPGRNDPALVSRLKAAWIETFGPERIVDEPS